MPPIDRAPAPDAGFDVAPHLWGVFENAPFGQMFSGMDGRIAMVNAHLATTLGYADSELVGRRILDLIDPIDHGATIAARDALRDGVVAQASGLRRYLRKDGTRVPVRVITFIVSGPGGKQQGWASVIVGLTDFGEDRDVDTRDGAPPAALPRQLSLIAAVGRIVNRDLPSVELAVALIREICDRLGWRGGAMLRWTDGAMQPARVTTDGDVTRLDFEHIGWPQQPGPATMHGARGTYIVIPIAGAQSGQLALVFDVGEGGVNLSPAMVELLAGLLSRSIERMLVSRRVAESEAQFRAVFDSSPLAKALMVGGGHQLYAVNAAMCTLMGRSREELVGSSILDVTHPDDVPLVDQARAAAAGTGREHRYARRFLRPSGDVLTTETTVSWIHAASGAPLVLLQIEDVTGERQLRRRLAEQADIDQLTGVASRLRLHRELDEIDSKGGDFAILFLDLDGFGAINDARGHAAGDEVLCAVALRLTLAAASTDLVARVGGDEFAIVCRPDHRSAAGAALELADHVEVALAQPIPLSGGAVHVGASIGICDSTIPARSATERLQRADAAAHEAKRLGKHRRIVYDATLHASNTESRRIETLLEAALEDSRFVVHYQPIVNIGTARIVEMEALVRLLDADGHLISPTAFIPIAEHTGLIGPMGTWVLREACRRVGELNRTLGVRPSLAVNVSARQAARADLVDVVTCALGDAELPAEALTVELTESTLLEADHGTLRRLAELRTMGVGIALDDFGTGYSSLTYLRQLPITKLKIDQSFVSRVTTEPASAAIIRAVTHLAADLGLAWTAEGIETYEQWDAMREFGPGFGQGFYFARPTPSEGLADLLGAAQLPAA